MARVINIPSEYKTIKAGIELVQPGDTVFVSPGIFYERIKLRPGIILLGSGADLTIIDGSKKGDIVIGANQAEISRFTIQNSGEMYCAIKCIGSSPLIRKNRIIHNGEGIVCIEGAKPIIEFNIITHSDDGSDFGTTAIKCDNSSPKIINNTICKNLARYAVFCDSASPIIKNNIISDNWGGIGCFNNTIAIINYNNIWHNSTYENFSNCKPGKGNISKDPQFIDFENGDYRLRQNSPCIGAGDPADISHNRPRIDLGAIEFSGP
jgi:hypothetical protein